MLVNKTVQIEQNVDALLVELKNVIVALKSGKSVLDVAGMELLKLQAVIAEVSAVPGEVVESKSATIRTLLLGVGDLANVLLGIQ